MLCHGTYVAHADILDEIGGETHAFLDFFENGVHQVLDSGVLKAALLGLTERGPDGEGDNDIVGVLRRSSMPAVSVWTCLLHTTHAHIYIHTKEPRDMIESRNTYVKTHA